MLTIRQAAESVGLSERQLRRRIEATAPLLAPYVRRGEKNRLLLDQGAVEILRAVEDRRANGHTTEEAIAYVADSMGGKQGSEQGQGNRETGENTSGEVLQVRVEMLERLLREIERDRDHWRGIAEHALAQLPAPKPQRQRRWLFWRRFTGESQAI